MKERRERLLALALTLVLAAALMGIKYVRIDMMRGDAAIFMQLLENANTQGRMVSDIFASTQDYLDSRYTRMPPANMALDPLAPPAQAERTMLNYHADYILYPLALFARLCSPLLVLLAVFALSFAALPLLSYTALREARLPIAACLLFCALIAASPAWAQSALFGQFYPDRIFMAAGLAFMLRTARPGSSRVEQLCLAGLCLLINERAAVTAGAFAVLYAGLYAKSPMRERMFKALLGVTLLAYGFIMTHMVLENPAYASFLPTSLGALIDRFSHPAFTHMTAMYLLVCLPFLVLAAFDKRALLIAFVLMLPNILGKFGGGEKIGWSTHYHSYDFPVLVWAAIMGFTHLVHTNTTYRRTVAYALPALLALFLTLLDPGSYDHPSITPAQFASSFFVQFPQQALADLSPGGFAFANVGNRLRAEVPPGSTVSSVEIAMPQLYRARNLLIFPIGIDTARYVVVNDYGPSAQGVRYRGTPHFGPPAVAQEIDAVILTRMRKDGYDFAHAVVIPSLSVAIVKRDPSANASARRL